jgi:tetratricopeptide (TPR) repeat protein
MKQVNIRLLVLLVGTVVVGVVGTYFLHRFQVARNAGGIAILARSKLDEGKTDEALALYGRYLGYRRDDADALAEYAKLLLDRASRPDANRNDFARAFTILEEAVRKKPADHELRRKLADFQLRIGRYAGTLHRGFEAAARQGRHRCGARPIVGRRRQLR